MPSRPTPSRRSSQSRLGRQRASAVVKFIEGACCHTKGRWAGLPFKLTPWQTAFVAAQLQSLPAEIFQPSGVTPRPQIYFVGTLFGKAVYYSPKFIDEDLTPTDGSAYSDLLMVGRSAQVGRCPILLGDSVAPTFIPLATNADFNQNSGMYARDYTVVNPHTPSALGCARLRLIGVK